jgi:hypothetical protein
MSRPRKIKSFSPEEIAQLRATLQPASIDQMLNRDEKPYRGQNGSIVAGCEHVLDFELNQNRAWEQSGLIIGGLDAHLCKLCNCWWVDAQMRAQILDSKRASFAETTRDNAN